MKRYVYDFSEGSMEMKPILGGKGAGLCEMTKIKLPVPPGFIITVNIETYSR
jgi:pyruvate, orthophosphate dikinase